MQNVQMNWFDINTCRVYKFFEAHYPSRKWLQKQIVNLALLKFDLLDG